MNSTTLLRSVSLRQLQYFVAIAECRSFRKAADALGMSQPPLTLQIRSLERAIGASLMTRTSRGIFLTAAGEAFRHAADEIIDSLLRGYETTQAAERAIEENLIIGITDDFVHSPLLNQIGDFVRANPTVTIEIRVALSSQLCGEVANGAIDVAVTNLPLYGASKSLRVEMLESSRIVALVPLMHRFATCGCIEPADLHSEALILMPDSAESTFATQCARLLESEHGKQRTALRTTNSTVCERMVAHGVGIALASQFSIAGNDPLVKQVQIKSRLAILRHALVANAERRNAAVERLIESICGKPEARPVQDRVPCRPGSMTLLGSASLRANSSQPRIQPRGIDAGIKI
jgi:DNA-binding transcriptional LysR family regulator